MPKAMTSHKVKEDPLLYRLRFLEEVANGDQNFILSILETFIEKAPKHLQDLKEGVFKKNGETLRFSAHQLKASIDLLGIDQLKLLIRTLETDAKNENPNWSQIDSVRMEVHNVLTSVISQIQENELRNSQ